MHMHDVRAKRDVHSARNAGAIGGEHQARFAVRAIHVVDVTPQVPPGQGNAYTASYRQLVRHFIDTAQGVRPIELPYEQVDLMRLIQLAYLSAAEGREAHA